MKRLILMISLLLCLCSCSASINGRGGNSSNCNCNNHEYVLINKYEYVEKSFLPETAEFFIRWKEIDEQGAYTGVVKEWTVYLTGYYILGDSAGYYVFYECEINEKLYDYYLVKY